jgi:CHAD domain-containing protein
LRLADVLEREADAGSDWAAASAELVRRRAIELSRLSAADADAEADPHALRIAAKRLRYAMEFAERTGAGEHGACVRRLRRMQEALGDWHDRFVLAEELAAQSGSTEAQAAGLSAPLLKAAAGWMKAADRELAAARRHRRGVQEALTGHVPQTRARIEERNAGRGAENGRQRVGRRGGVRTGAG